MLDAIKEFSDAQIRQCIDAEATFSAWMQARKDAREVRGSMFWREQAGRTYLIRRSTTGAQTSLGPRSDETEAMFARFAQRKADVESREKRLGEQTALHRRMNRALSLGRLSPVVVGILNALDVHGVADEFRVVGTHALFAYAAAARVHLDSGATATRDVDLLFDMRKRLRFVRAMQDSGKSLLQVVQFADASFRLREDQRYTAVNDRGFEVDVIRRFATEDDPHPLRMSQSEDDFWAVQTDWGGPMQDGGLMEQMVIATDGSMARMRTISPDVFQSVKGALAASRTRDPGKARRDQAQSALVGALVKTYLPQWANRAQRETADAPPAF